MNFYPEPECYRNINAVTHTQSQTESEHRQQLIASKQHHLSTGKAVSGNTIIVVIL